MPLGYLYALTGIVVGRRQLAADPFELPWVTRGFEHFHDETYS
jgi:hypothetical protein